ncbi:MAG: histidine phosphatase family protein [Saprospiraceae bacterium]|nr:histidine phosphatase family protein [Saprospiraceae bacterium]
MFKYHFLVLILCCLGSTFTPALAQDTDLLTTVIFVRHAEKADDGTRNPPLNIYGQERAARLAQLFHLSGLAGIYSTPFHRTQQTVDPLAKALGLEVMEYPPLKLEALDQLVKDQKGKTILIVGHSNTVPAMVNHLLGEEKLEQLSENEYDKIFMVQITDNQTQLLQLSF